MRRVLVAVLVLAAGAGGLAAPGDDVSPVGEPEVKAGTLRKFYVWCDKELDGWHIRTTSLGKGASKTHEFAGTVRLTGGSFKSVTAVKAEERGKRADFWELKDSGRTLTFKLNTGTAVDGLDFVISPKATQIDFDLTIDGEPNGKQVKFGKEAKSMRLSKVFFKLR